MATFFEILNQINFELLAHLCGLAFVAFPILLAKHRHKKNVMTERPKQPS